MRGRLVFLGIAGLAACGTLEGGSASEQVGAPISEAGPDVDTPPSVDGGGDASASDAAPASCDPSAPFVTFEAFDDLATTFAGFNMSTPRLTDDELTLYFESDNGNFDLWHAVRKTTALRFGTLHVFDELQSPNGEIDAQLTSTPDASDVFFASTRDAGDFDLYRAKRASGYVPAKVYSVTGADDQEPFYVRSTHELWFTSTRALASGPHRVYSTTVDGSGVVDPVELPPIVPTLDYRFPVLSADGMTLFVSIAGPGSASIYVSHRTSLTAKFMTLATVEELNSAAEQYPGWLSPDNCRMYYTRRVDGAKNRLALAKR